MSSVFLVRKNHSREMTSAQAGAQYPIGFGSYFFGELAACGYKVRPLLLKDKNYRRTDSECTSTRQNSGGHER